MTIRSWPERIGIAVAIMLPASLAIAMVTKAVLFDPNWKVHPVCWGSYGARQLGGPLTEVFRNGVAGQALAHLMPHGYRVDRYNVYISILDWDIDTLANHTTKVIESLEEEEMVALARLPAYIDVKKRRGQFPPRPSEDGDVDCELVESIAIEGWYLKEQASER